MEKDKKHNMAVAYSVQRKNRKKMTRGGMLQLSEPLNPSLGSKEDDLAHEIMQRHMMADGGEVIPGDNSIEEENTYDMLNRKLGGHQMYDEESALEDLSIPSDDGMDSVDMDSDEYDMINNIRRKHGHK